MHVFRCIDRERFQFDFLLESDQPGAYDDEIRELGGNLHYAGSPKRLYHFARAFRSIVRKYGPYDVVHSHVHHASGLMLALAAWQGIPVRIAHSHNDLQHLQQQSSPVRKAYFRVTEQLVARLATAGLAPSAAAAASLFGPQWASDRRYRQLQYGIDLKPFGEAVQPDLVRASLGIDPADLVIGHVGSFTPQKNHAFLLDVFNRIRIDVPGARLLLVGQGPLQSEIEKQVEALGMRDSVVFSGVRSNVPEIMMGAMDCFLFPSTHEGLGIVLIECQAAGLPSVISEVIPPEADVVPELVRRLPLAAGPDVWARATRELLDKRPASGRARKTGSTLEGSVYDVAVSARAMEEVYSGSQVKSR